MGHVIYLTGAPASGKSTLCQRLGSGFHDLRIYHYSKLLADHLNRKNGGGLIEDELRAKSSKVITPQDVDSVDNFLIEEVTRVRNEAHIIIDSHAVTKEQFGFRVTPFSYRKLRALYPTIICMLYAESQEITRRIAKQSGGRPSVTPFQADFHITLQSQVALAYSLELGLPLYVFDSTKSLDEAESKLGELMQRKT